MSHCSKKRLTGFIFQNSVYFERGYGVMILLNDVSALFCYRRHFELKGLGSVLAFPLTPSHLPYTLVMLFSCCYSSCAIVYFV